MMAADFCFIVSYHIRAPNVYVHVEIRPYPLHSGHMSHHSEERTQQIKIFSKRQPVERIHGSNPWVGRKSLAGQGDPIRNMTCSYGSFGAWWVRSGREVFKLLWVRSGRVGSGQEVLDISHGSGRVESPDPSQPARFDLTREKPWKIPDWSILSKGYWCKNALNTYDLV